MNGHQKTAVSHETAGKKKLLTKSEKSVTIPHSNLSGNYI